MHHILQPLYLKKSGLHTEFTKKWRTPTTSLKFQCVDVEQCWSFDELSPLLLKLNFVGPYLATDMQLYIKVLRVCTTYVKEYLEIKTPSELQTTTYHHVRSTIVNIFLPGLSILEYNCCISEEMWDLVSMFSYEERYTMYSEWKKNSLNSQKYPLLMKAVNIISAKTKYVLKRITKDNIKEYGRQIGKLSHSNPVIIFHLILNQIQQFDNFIIPIVDSLKFLTSLTYDVIAFSVVDSVTLNTDTRLKLDDTNVSQWLQSTAGFAAAAFRRYAVDMAGILHYVVRALVARRSDDLVLLRDLVAIVAGVELSAHRTDQQLAATTGGICLLQGAYYNQNQIQRKAATRLMEAVLKYDLALPILILIGQERDRIVHVQPEHDLPDYVDPVMQDKRPLKLIGHLFDLCTDTLHQFLSFVEQNVNPKDAATLTPDVGVLMSQYNLSIEVSFSFCRNILKNDIWTKYIKSVEKSKPQCEKKELLSEDDKSMHYSNSYADVMGPVVDMLETRFNNETWEGLSHEIFTIFWTLSLSDLEVPKEAYSRQASALNSEIKTIDNDANMSSYKKKKEKEKLTTSLEKLNQEQKLQEENVVRVLDYFESNSTNWFTTKSAKVGHMLMQLMIFPRCSYTSLDAIYCAKFLLLLHRTRIENFYSLICFDKIFIEIALPMSLCSENEAERYGRFLCTLFCEINRWHSDVNIYNRECIDHPGFKTCFKGGAGDKDPNESEQLDYENYRHIVHKWHHSITKLFVYNLESNKYQQVKTSLIIMKQILPVYPIVEKLGLALQRRVQRVCDNEKKDRPDLWALAMGYLGQMNIRQKHWINENKFHEDKTQKSSKKSSKRDITKDVDTSAKDTKKRKIETNATEQKEKRPRDESSDHVNANTTSTKNNKEYTSKKSKSSSNLNSPREKSRSRSSRT